MCASRTLNSHGSNSTQRTQRAPAHFVYPLLCFCSERTETQRIYFLLIGNWNNLFKITVFDWDKNGGHDVIGYQVLTLRELVTWGPFQYGLIRTDSSSSKRYAVGDDSPDVSLTVVLDVRWTETKSKIQISNYGFGSYSSY